MSRQEQSSRKTRPSKSPAVKPPTTSSLRKTRPEPATAPMRLRAPTPPSYEEIARRAYELYEARGHAHGFDVEDWVRAERELTSR